MATRVPANPKYNLKQIFTRTLVGIVVVSIITAIIAQVSYNQKDLENVSYVIDTFNCKVPYFEPASLKDLKTKRTKRLLPCSKPKNQKRFLTSIISTTSVDDPLNIKIHEKFFKDYGVSSVSCCFRTISRVQESDVLIKINETCTKFENNYRLDNKHDTILVECSSDGKVIYKNVHATITRKKDFVERQRKSKIDKSRAYKVLLVGFDSMSRMTFPRGMPKTFKLFHGKKEWIEMKGYTRLGNESFPNLFAVLTGKQPTEKYGKCNPIDKTFLDNCDFIWNEYEKAGYATAYAEDQMARSTFNLRHKGFNKRPTDHYFRPFVIVAEKHLEVNVTNGLAYCLGTSLYLEHIFVYAMKMITIHEHDPFFGMFYVNSLSDKQFSSSPPLDNKVSHSFLSELEDKNDTIVIYFSDTGLRFEENQNGFYEERSPFLAIRLPLKFQNDYPQFTENLKVNVNRLTTPYDLYATLRHIINLSTGKKLETKSLGCRMCKSLFYKISMDRRCIDVHIPHDSCPCSLEKLNGSEEVVQFAAQHSVEVLNQNLTKMKTKTGGTCTKLNLLNVTSAYQQVTSPWHIQYIIQFEVSPTLARFEALLERKIKTIIFKSPQFELMQAIVQLAPEGPICVPSSLSRQHGAPIIDKQIAEQI